MLGARRSDGIPRAPRSYYVGGVPPLPTARALALFVAFSGAFAAPISALAHGHAHQHEAANHHQATPDAAFAEPREHGSADHGHPSIGVALTSKVATPLLALVPQRVTLPAATVVQTMPPIADTMGEHRAQLAQGPPPRLRAPPA